MQRLDASEARGGRLGSLTLLALALVASGCGGPSEHAQAATPPGGERPDAAPLLVRTVAVERADLTRGLRATATLESTRHTTISTEVAGRVIAAPVDVGDPVVAHKTVLLRLDDTRLRMAFEEAKLQAIEATQRADDAGLAVLEAERGRETAKISLAEATSNLTRVENLSEKSLVSEGDLDTARFSRKRAVVGVAASELALRKAHLGAKIARTLAEKAALARDRVQLDWDHAVLKAPISGVVAVRSVRSGDSVAAGQAVLELTDQSSLRARVFLPQKNLPLLRRDMAVEVRADARPDALGAGRVERMPRTVDAATGNVRLDVRLEKTEGFLPGMFVTLRLVTHRRDRVPVIPKKAMRLEGEEALVYRITDGVAHAVRFKPGLGDADRVEVPADVLAVGDRVVLVGVDQLHDGDRVQEAASKPAARE